MGHMQQSRFIQIVYAYVMTTFPDDPCGLKVSASVAILLFLIFVMPKPAPYRGRLPALV
jgi:hypothetical protein